MIINRWLMPLIIFPILLQTGCLNQAWTGVSLLYDRHTAYKKSDDMSLAARAGHILVKDKRLKCPTCQLDLAVLNKDILLVGWVPSVEMREEATRRIETIPGYRRLFNQLAIGYEKSDSLKDTWITAKVRSQILADSDINPRQFKVMTHDRVVYLMGDVYPDQAKKVILIARSVADVKRVVKLFKYIHLSDEL